MISSLLILQLLLISKIIKKKIIKPLKFNYKQIQRQNINIFLLYFDQIYFLLFIHFKISRVCLDIGSYSLKIKFENIQQELIYLPQQQQNSHVQQSAQQIINQQILSAANAFSSAYPINVEKIVLNQISLQGQDVVFTAPEFTPDQIIQEFVKFFKQMNASRVFCSSSLQFATFLTQQNPVIIYDIGYSCQWAAVSLYNVILQQTVKRTDMSFKYFKQSYGNNPLQNTKNEIESLTGSNTLNQATGIDLVNQSLEMCNQAIKNSINYIILIGGGCETEVAERLKQQFQEAGYNTIIKGKYAACQGMMDATINPHVWL